MSRDEFPKEYVPTVFENYVTDIEVFLSHLIAVTMIMGVIMIMWSMSIMSLKYKMSRTKCPIRWTASRWSSRCGTLQGRRTMTGRGGWS